tara:strand:- start:14481 stop:14645 length:165 start_codon:yes stop_codon:yes gene_type:complete
MRKNTLEPNKKAIKLLNHYSKKNALAKAISKRKEMPKGTIGYFYWKDVIKIIKK